MRKIILLFLLISFLTGKNDVAQAVTIDFEGTISGISRNSIGLPISNGSLFSGKIYFETNVPDKNSSSHTAEYSAFLSSYITVNVGGYSYTQPINNITIYDNKPVATRFLDRFFVNAGNIGGTGGLQLWIDSQYSNPPPEFLNSTALIAPDLNLSYSSAFVVRNPDIDFYGSFISFTAIPVLPATIPVADAGADQVIMKIGTTVQLDGTQSYDHEGDAITYNWSLISKPQYSKAVLSDPNSPNPTFQADVRGEYIIKLFVKDISSSSAPDRVVISMPAQAPTDYKFKVTAITSQIDSRGYIAAQGGLAIGDILIASVFWDSPLEPLNPIEGGSFYSKLLGYSLHTTDFGDGTFTNISDGYTYRPAISVTYNSPAHGLVFHGVYYSGGGTETIRLMFDGWLQDGTATNINGEVFTVGRDRQDGVSSILFNAEMIRTIPIAAAGVDQAIMEIGTTVQLDGSQSYDPEGDAITYNWSIVSKPINSNSILSDNTSSTPTFQADIHGEYVIELVVSNDFSSSVPDQVVVSLLVPVMGDLNGNSSVDIDDYYEVFEPTYAKCTGDATYNPVCDFDKDGCVTLVDLYTLYQYYLDYQATLNPQTQP